MQPGSEQLAGWSVVNRPTAFYRARPGPAFTNTNSCYCQSGLKSIFSHIKLSKLSVLTLPHPYWKRRRSNTYLNDIALSTMWFISPGHSRFTTQLFTRHPLLRFETVPKHWSQFFHQKLNSEFKSALPLAMHEISVSTNFLVFCKFGRSVNPLKTCNLHCILADHKTMK